jgi:hypothetical protein
MSDRFDFEQQIIKCWSVVNDLKDLDEGLFEGWLSFTQDDVSNQILAVANLYDVKFNKLWNLFESVHMDLVRENKMLNEECAALREQLIFETQGHGAGGKPKESGAGQPSLFGLRTDVDEDGFAVIKSNKKGKK